MTTAERTAYVLEKPLDDTVQYRAHLLNTLRRSDEGQEGMTAFLQKRPPNWAKE